ncbi:hypothetical protein WR25_25683 [Diploscapter pachys]|uniref:Uncharacterized protein n=1 Tax=Diploscapter pachys TaxID=2018661 RepID=A0A2A2K6D3_9BILA|nr:hypothetical protein WR25_25683 [Diploscapter pachys]
MLENQDAGGEAHHGNGDQREEGAARRPVSVHGVSIAGNDQRQGIDGVPRLGPRRDCRNWVDGWRRVIEQLQGQGYQMLDVTCAEQQQWHDQQQLWRPDIVGDGERGDEQGIGDQEVHRRADSVGATDQQPREVNLADQACVAFDHLDRGVQHVHEGVPGDHRHQVEHDGGQAIGGDLHHDTEDDDEYAYGDQRCQYDPAQAEDCLSVASLEIALAEHPEQ